MNSNVGISDSNDSNDSENKPPDNIEKWLIAIMLGVIFLIVAAPLIFKFSNQIFNYINIHTLNPDGRPSVMGWIIHTVIFIIIVRVLMK